MENRNYLLKTRTTGNLIEELTQDALAYLYWGKDYSDDDDIDELAQRHFKMITERSDEFIIEEVL